MVSKASFSTDYPEHLTEASVLVPFLWKSVQPKIQDLRMGIKRKLKSSTQIVKDHFGI